MSKTDKTAPFRVRQAAYPGLTCTPVHDHRQGACTLHPDPMQDLGWVREGCYWTPTTWFWVGRDGGCGCPSCTGQHWRRMDLRRSRHQARARAGEARRLINAGADPDEF